MNPYTILRRLRRTLTVLAVVVTAVLVVQPPSAEAHCDSVDGPVVTAARQSLQTGDVRTVLAYVQPEAEHELTAAFKSTRAVRTASPAARNLAEQYFFETAVRLHRAGEGAPYTGLVSGQDYGPALEAAEKAVATGNPRGVESLLARSLQAGLTRRWKAVESARAAAARSTTVETLRAKAQAELEYEVYVHELDGLISGEGHGETEAATGGSSGAAGAEVQAAHTHGSEG